ncbi:MAG TPA: hypothetical protein VJI74_02640 [Candidatus Paceibacterota bacterium]
MSYLLPILIEILYRLNRSASKSIVCYGNAASCIEKPRYAFTLTPLAALESMLLRYTERLSPAEMENAQRIKMKHILASAAKTPRWKKIRNEPLILSKKLERMRDLSALPILTRADIQADFRAQRLVNHFLPAKQRALANTSGSTGQPLFFFFDTRSVSGSIALLKRQVRWLTKKKVWVVKNIGRDFGLGSMKRVSCIASDANSDFAVASLYVFLRNLFHSTHLPILMKTTSSRAMVLAELVKQSGLTCPFVIEGFICGGESLLPGEREYVKEVFSCNILGNYAATELGVIGQECGQHPEHAFHINAEYFYVEIVDESGTHLPPGDLGRVIITSLENEAMPFIRYDTGDLGRLLVKPCPCGRTLPLLTVEGRVANLVKLPDGKALTQFSIESIFHDETLARELSQFQIIHEKLDTFKVKIVLADPNRRADDVLNLLRKKLGAKFGKDVSVHLEIVKNIEISKSGKRMGYLSKI